MAIKGIDVAKYQPVNPDPAALPGISFYIAKATEGTTPDPTYSAHITHARGQSIPLVGAYHFATNAIPIKDQVAAFLKTAGKVDAYVVDREGANEISQSQFTEFLNRMHDAGLLLGLYGSENDFPYWGQDWSWIANYSREPKKPYDLWQYGPFANAVDGDIYMGTLAQLKDLWGVQVAQASITDETQYNVTTGPNSIWYDIDGSVLLSGRPALTTPRISPYGVGEKRAIYANVGTKRQIVLVVPATKTPIPPPDCSTQVAAAIAADRAKAHIVISYDG